MSNSGDYPYKPLTQDHAVWKIRRKWRHDSANRQISDFDYIHEGTCICNSITTSGLSTGTATIVFLILVILLSACSSYKATADRQEQLRYDALRVQPAWEHQERQSQKFILPAMGLAAGAVYGYQTEFTYGGETFEGAENAALWAGVGLVGGVVLNKSFFSKRSRSRRAFELSQSDEWLRSWNKTTGSDYLIRENSANNSLILVSRARVVEIRQAYKNLEEDLSQSRPSTSYTELQVWKRMLSGEYSILPPAELNYIRQLISANESKVASADLEAQLATIEAMEPTYNTITSLLGLRHDLGPIYQLANSETRQKFDGYVRDRIASVLTQLLPEEERKVDRVSLSMTGIEELNGLFRDFDRRFSMFQDYELVEGMYEHFHTKKEEILTANAAQIAAQIEGASDVDEIQSLETRYFVALHSESREVADVRRKLTQRKEAIITAESQARIAAQQRFREALAAIQAEWAADNAELSSDSFSARGSRNETRADIVVVDGDPQQWAQRYRDATPISQAEFLERITTVRVRVSAAPFVTQHLPIEDIFDLIVQQVRAAGIEVDSRAPVILDMNLLWEAAEWTTRRNGQVINRSPIHSIRFTTQFLMTAPVYRDGDFYMAEFAPAMQGSSGALNGKWSRGPIRNAIAEAVTEHIADIQRRTSRDASLEIWKTSLWAPARDVAMHAAYQAVREGDSTHLAPAMAGMSDFQLAGFDFYGDARSLLRSTGKLENQWHSRLQRLGFRPNAESRNRITHDVVAIKEPVSAGARLFGPLGQQFYALSSRVRLWEDNVAFDLNGEIVLMNVVHSSHIRVEVTMPGDANLGNLARGVKDAFLTEKFEENMSGHRSRR